MRGNSSLTVRVPYEYLLLVRVPSLFFFFYQHLTQVPDVPVVVPYLILGLASLGPTPDSLSLIPYSLFDP